MVGRVVAVQPDGLLMVLVDAKPEGTAAWLPCEEWGLDPGEWDDAWESTVVGDEIDVVEVPLTGGPCGKVVVSRKRLGLRDVDETWLQRARLMTVHSVGKELIYGLIGNVPAVMRRESYREFLAEKKVSKVQSHGYLARGDLLRVVVAGICRAGKGEESDGCDYGEGIGTPSTGVKVRPECWVDADTEPVNSFETRGRDI